MLMLISRSSQVACSLLHRPLHLNFMVLLCTFVLILGACSGTDIPNGMSNGNDIAGVDDPNSSDGTDNPNPSNPGSPSDPDNIASSGIPPQITGRVSRGNTLSDTSLYVLDNRNRVMGQVTTDSTGSFTLNTTTLGTLFAEANYPLVVLVPTSPALMTTLPAKIASTELTIDVNPVTSETLRTLLSAQVDLDSFAIALQDSTLITTSSGNTLVDSNNNLLVVPNFHIQDTTSFPSDFQQQGDALVNAVFGENSLSPEGGTSPFQVFWGNRSPSASSQTVRVNHVATTANQTSVATELIDILLLGIETQGEIETVLQEASANPDTSGNLFSRSSFLNEVAAIASIKSASSDVYASLVDAQTAQTLQNTQSAITETTTALTTEFLKSDGAGTSTEAQLTLSPALCIGVSYNPTVSTDQGNIAQKTVSMAGSTTLTEQKQREILAQSLATILTQAQEINSAAFQSATDTSVYDTVSVLGATAVTEETNRVFAKGEVNLLFLQSFVDSLVGPVGVTVGGISELEKLQSDAIAASVQTNVTSAARNVGLFMEAIFQRLQANTALSEVEKLEIATQQSQAIQTILQGKDISDQNGGLSDADEKQIYCELVNTL